VTLLEALQFGLAVEHQAVYGYGLVIARLRGEQRAPALAALRRHQERRDQIAELVAGLHVEPTPAAPAYLPPTPVTDAATAIDLATRIEDDSAGAAWDVVAASAPSSPARRLGVAWMVEATKRAGCWHALAGTPAPSMPGQPDASQPSTTSTSSPSESTTPSGSTS
jgi:hypothetical protein